MTALTIRKNLVPAALAIGALFMFSPLAYAQAATLTTDQADYAPGSLATIFGSSFAVLEEVVMTIVGVSTDGSTATDASWNVSADDAGSFTTTYQLPDFYVPLYMLAANSTTGEVLAETTFTDANLNVTVAGAGTGNGSVAAANISCTSTAGSTSGDCAQTYGGNPATATLMATAASGSTFTGWSGACSGTGTCALSSANGVNQTATATFTLNAVVPLLDQTITFGALGGKTFGDADFGVSATADSGLAVSFSSETPSVCTVTGSTVHIVSAGICTVRASQAGNGTYNPALNVDQSFTVAKATPTVSVDNSPVTYDGSAQSAVVTGSVAGVASTVLYDGSATVPTDAGIYAVTADFVPTDTTNYESLVAASAGDFTIDQASSTTTVSCPANVTYTGVAQTPCTVSVTGAGDLNLTPTADHSNNMNAGTASASYTYAGDANHTGSDDSTDFTIDQAPLTITASSGSMIQGASVPAITASYDGFVNGETESVLADLPVCSTTAESLSAPGDYPTSCVGATAVNYSITPVGGTMHVYAWTTVFVGLFKPITSPAKDLQKNSTLPVKFALNGGLGNFYGGVATLEIADHAAPTVWKNAKSSGGSNVGNTFRYDASAGQYIFNLSTKDNVFVANHTYDFRITMFGTPLTLVQVAAIKVTK
jgi:hypothetical protein